MDKIIEIYSRNNYGVLNYYVKDPVLAETISGLTGRKTISVQDMKLFKKLGFRVVLSIDPAVQIPMTA